MKIRINELLSSLREERFLTSKTYLPYLHSQMSNCEVTTFQNSKHTTRNPKACIPLRGIPFHLPRNPSQTLPTGKQEITRHIIPPFSLPLPVRPFVHSPMPRPVPKRHPRIRAHEFPYQTPLTPPFPTIESMSRISGRKKCKPGHAPRAVGHA